MNCFRVATLSASVLVGFESINETPAFMLHDTGLLSPWDQALWPGAHVPRTCTGLTRV